MFIVCFFQDYKKEYDYRLLVAGLPIYEQKGKTPWQDVDMVKVLFTNAKMDAG